MTPPPLATYRLQTNKDFTFDDAATITPYLKQLHVSHLYLSPVLDSVPGSNHGYDGTDFAKISADRGGEDAFARLDSAALESGLKSIIDIVPNHMGIAGRNPYWEDVLKNGPRSAFWPLFDIRTKDGAKIRLPLLSAPLAHSLASGESRLSVQEDGAIGLSVNDRFLPFNDETQETLARRAKEKGLSVKDALETLSTFEQRRFIQEQHYKPIAADDVSSIDYRRFFHIFELIGLRVEDPEIYDLTHAKLKDMAAQYKSIDGVRVDHIDGLYDPGSYLQKLRQDFPAIWVEKILTGRESLPDSWQVEGTTGYDFIPLASRLMVDASNFNDITQHWRENIQSRWKSFDDCVSDSKEEILHTLFPSELERIINLSGEDGGMREKARIFWSGITASMKMYRTYATDSTFNDQDAHVLWKASELARRRYGDAYGNSEVFLLPRLLNPLTPPDKQARLEWQQLTGPVIAKGLEDTAHYRYTPLAAFNEVGCEPNIFRNNDQHIFETMTARGHASPHTLNATSTHDTKRSEDTRHRLYALADDPQSWFSFFNDASHANDGRATASGERWLDKPTEHFFYQTLIGTFPIDGVIDGDYIERLGQYMNKATKEGGLQSSWARPDHVYDERLQNFIRATLSDDRFIDGIRPYAGKVAGAGALNSLSMQTLKILGPGIPDLYQGTESWDFSLVDPDNRRPVDYDTLYQTLTNVDQFQPLNGRARTLDKLTHEWKNGAIKQWLTRELLDIRAQYIHGREDAISLHPLPAGGSKSQHLLAYRIDIAGKPQLAVVAPRRSTTLLAEHFNALQIEEGAWEDTHVTLPGNNGNWTEILQGKKSLAANGKVSLNQINRFPVAVFAHHAA